MRLHPVSIKRRLILSQLSVVFAVLALFSIFRFVAEVRTSRESVAARLASIATIVGHNCTSALDFQDQSDAATTLASVASEPQVSHAWVLDANGRVFADYRRAGVEAESPPVGMGDHQEVESGRLTVSHPVVRDGQAIGSVVLRYDLDGFWTILLHHYPSALLALVGGMAIALTLALRTQRTLSMPIIDLANASQRITTMHDLSIRMPEERRDELGVLYRGFNAMLADLQAREHERDEALTALLESEQKYRELVMLANSIILRWSRDGRIVFLNEFGQRFFGYTESEILGRHVVGTIIPETESTGRDLRPLMNEIFADPQKFERNINEAMRQGGGRVWIDWTNKVVLDEQGQIDEILSIGSDITERKRAEEQVQRLNEELRRHAEDLEQRVLARTAQLAAKNEELKEFAYTVSHDLKAPLRGIAGYANELDRKHRAGLSDRAHFCLTQILTATSHLDQLIEDLLRYSRLDAETPSPTVVDVGSIVEMILRDRDLAIKDQQIEVTVDIPFATVQTWDRGLVQVLSNLIDNAIKYSRKANPPRLRIAATCLDGLWRLMVSDNGIGFDMKYHDRIFKLFNRLVRMEEFEGTGAGLAIARKVLEKQGGRIWAESAPGQGATFFVELPKPSEGA